ncbi:MAG: hypothetical protein ACJ795_16145, partial [Ktedonobacteraceae bacterium]
VTRAMMLLLAASLGRGNSGVRLEIVITLILLIAAPIAQITGNVRAISALRKHCMVCWCGLHGPHQHTMQ